jgi:hypothetical protein
MITEFVKSFGSFTLAMSLLGLQLVQDVMTPTGRGEHKGPATKTLDRIRDTTADQFGPTLRSTFQVLDNAQRGAIALAFGAAWPFGRNTYRSLPMRAEPPVETVSRARRLA